MIQQVFGTILGNPENILQLTLETTLNSLETPMKQPKNAKINLKQQKTTVIIPPKSLLKQCKITMNHPLNVLAIHDTFYQYLNTYQYLKT